MNNRSRILRAKAVAKRLGIPPATLWNKANPKSRHYHLDFPQPIKVSANVTGWIESEITAYIEKCATERKVTGITIEGIQTVSGGEALSIEH